MSIFLPEKLDSLYGAQPLTLVDVGARGGLQPNWMPAQPRLRLIGFEPDPAEHARLARGADPRKLLYIQAALHRQAAELTFKIGRSGGTSSFLEPDWEFLARFPDVQRYEAVQTIPMKVESLDRALAAHGVTDSDFLKIDTQGAELAILEGGRATLGALFGVELEVLFGRLYVGQPRFGQIESLLEASGFQLMDLRPSYWKRARGARYGGPKGQIAFADALYFKTERAFQAQFDAIADPALARAKLLRAISVCLLYGYVDYAIELFHPNRGRFEPAIAELIRGELETSIALSARIPHFRGRGWLSQLFYRLHRAFYPTLGGWASGARHLGNLD